MDWTYETPGIPEEMFTRGDVPITKTEIRVISISKLRLVKSSCVLDIGCGTGSLTVEAALICKTGTVYAIDKSEEAISLTKQNTQRFQVSNVEIMKGLAPFDLPDIRFDRVFIGGSSGNMESIIKHCNWILNKAGVIVINTILPENTYKALKALEDNGFSQIECICINISKSSKDSGWIMKALNPIWVISALKGN